MGQHRGAGGQDHNWFLIQRTLDVVVWVISLHKPPTHQQIIDRWGVHRATAWRWLEPLRDVHAKFQATQRVKITGAPVDLTSEAHIP